MTEKDYFSINCRDKNQQGKHNCLKFELRQKTPEMDAVLDIGGSQQINAWYKSLQGTFLKIGIEFGYQHEETKDFIHQFFLNLLEKNIDLDSIDNPKAYLATAFKRNLIDHHRKYGKVKLIPIEHNESELITTSIHDTLEQLEANSELISAIRKAFDKLPARCRKVIDLKFYRGFSTDEIVFETGLAPRTVYNNLFEGIKFMRQELEDTVPNKTIMALLPLLVFMMSTPT